MRQLSVAGQQAINDVAQRQGFSVDAVLSMLDSVIHGNGSMAQFNHPEFGGSGQWMQGGMTMVSDMFNNYLKGRVDGLCSELARLIANQPDLLRSGSFQSQSQGGYSNSQHQGGFEHQQQQNGQQQNGVGPMGPVSLFIPPTPGSSGSWWPADLSAPSSTGSQNGARYAYFPQVRRLAVEVNGQVTVYDTLDHQIGGFSQQQSYGGSMSFTSQYGLIEVSRLPIVSGAVASASGSGSGGHSTTLDVSAPSAFVSSQNSPGESGDIFTAIERLAQLHAKGILSDAEFASKKAELLARL